MEDKVGDEAVSMVVTLELEDTAIVEKELDELEVDLGP
jgi:hypothetical protein